MNGKILAALLLFCAVSAAAQTAEERGKKVIDDAIAALGGQKFLTMEDRIESGRVYTFYREQISSYSIAKDLHTLYKRSPGKDRRRPGRTGTSRRLGRTKIPLFCFVRMADGR